jgi:hypothetical protein
MATSLTNIDQFLTAGFERAQFVVSSSGLPYETIPTAGNGSGMSILYGANAANITLPSAEILQIPGDNGVRGAIQFASNALPTFDLTFADFKGTFLDKVQGTTEIDAQSIYDLFIIDPANRSFPDIFLLLTQRAVSTVAGEQGNGYNNVIFPLCTVGYTAPGAMQTGANASLHTFNVTVNRTTQLPWGTDLTAGTHGTTGASGFIFFSEAIPTFDVYRQDNSTTTYSPTQALNANEQVIGFDGAVGADPSTLATGVSSGDFTFTAQANNNLTTFLYEVA